MKCNYKTTVCQLIRQPAADKPPIKNQYLSPLSVWDKAPGDGGAPRITNSRQSQGKKFLQTFLIFSDIFSL
jgi:hypothetical protein